MGLALTYAKDELVPREKESGAAWRIIKREDGREDKSRDKQWRCYRSVAIAVGSLMRNGKTYEEAVSAIQERFESFGAKPHTPFLATINSEIKQMRSSVADVIAREDPVVGGWWGYGRREGAVDIIATRAANTLCWQMHPMRSLSIDGA
eukprot:2656847-Prymnesium_polylepis.1